MAGEITTSGKQDYARIARDTIRKIGYNDPELRFDADGCAVMVCYGRHPPTSSAASTRRPTITSIRAPAIRG